MGSGRVRGSAAVGLLGGQVPFGLDVLAAGRAADDAGLQGVPDEPEVAALQAGAGAGGDVAGPGEPEIPSLQGGERALSQRTGGQGGGGADCGDLSNRAAEPGRIST